MDTLIQKWVSVPVYHFICNICVDHILELAVFTVLVSASKSTSLLDPHTPIWCTAPSVSLNPQQPPFCGTPKSFSTPLCLRTKRAIQSWTETNRSHQSSKQPQGPSLFREMTCFVDLTAIWRPPPPPLPSLLCGYIQKLNPQRESESERGRCCWDSTTGEGRSEWRHLSCNL